MPEPDQYDAIGDRYEDALRLPAMEAMQNAMLALAGDVTGLDVLDVATGTGGYARAWTAGGARRVVAFDRSTEMVAAARRIGPATIDYHVADATTHPVFGSFDLVTAGYLLNYARDVDTMTGMAAMLHDNLRPGGRLVGMLPYPEYRFGWPEARRYGFDYSPVEEIGIGTVMAVTLYADDPPVRFESVLARREVYEAALTGAGFAPPRWVALHEPDPQRPDPAIDGLEANPPAILYETTRPA